MIKQPIYQTPEGQRRVALVTDFLVKYPHPFFAWAERQTSPFWRIVLSRHLTPEGKAVLIAGAFGGRSVKPPKMRELWDCYFRAAWATMVPKTREGRSWDDLSAEVLAEKFQLTRGRYERLVKAERRWQKKKALRPEKELKIGETVIRYTPDGFLSSVLPELAKLPAIEELVERLLKVPAK